MKRFIFLIAFCFPSLFMFSQELEGTIEISVVGEYLFSYAFTDKNFKSKTVQGAECTFLFTLKGDKTTLEIEHVPEQTLKIITDKNSDKATQVVTKDGIEKAVVLDANYFQNQAKGGDEEVEIINLDTTKIINGYLCDKYSVNSDKIDGIVWATSEININLAERMFVLRQNDFYDQINGIDGFIMEINGKDSNGNDFLLKTTIDKKDIDDKHFEVNLDSETMKLLKKREKMLIIADEYRQKMLDAGDDMDKIKELSEEMKIKMKKLR